MPHPWAATAGASLSALGVGEGCWPWTLQPEGGDQGLERAWDWVMSGGTLPFPKSLRLASSSSAFEGPQVSSQTGVPAVYVPGAPGSPAPCHPQRVHQQSLLPSPGGQAQKAPHPCYHASRAGSPHSHVKTPVQAHTHTLMPMWMHLGHAFFDAHTHAHRDTPMCMHLTTYSHAHTHAHVQAPLHTDTCTHLCSWICAHTLFLKHTHTHSDGQAPVYRHSPGEHTQIRMLTRPCTCTWACTLSLKHTHTCIRLCACSCACALSHIPMHTQRVDPCAWALSLGHTHGHAFSHTHVHVPANVLTNTELHTLMWALCGTPEGQTGPDPGVSHFLPGVDDKDLCSAGWSSVNMASLAAAQTWGCTGTRDHMGFAGLYWEQSGALRSGAGCLWTCALRSCPHTKGWSTTQRPHSWAVCQVSGPKAGLT